MRTIEEQKEHDALEAEVKRLRAGIVELFNKLWLTISPLPVESREERDKRGYLAWAITCNIECPSELVSFLAGIHYERNRQSK